MDAQVASLSMNSNGLAATLADRQAELDALIVLVPEKDAAIAALLVEKELATERAREEDDRHAFEVQKLETKIANTITEYQSTAHTQTTALQSITAELETAQESNDTLNNLLTVEKGLLDMANQSNEALKRDLESSYQTLASLREKVAQIEKSSRDSETYVLSPANSHLPFRPRRPFCAFLIPQLAHHAQDKTSFDDGRPARKNRSVRRPPGRTQPPREREGRNRQGAEGEDRGEGEGT